MFRLLANVMLVSSMTVVMGMSAQAQDVASTTVEKTIMPFERFLEGSVEAISQATVSAQTSGLVDQVLVSIGDHVPAGTVILKLVGVDQKEGLNQSKAALNEAQVQRKAEAQQYERVKSLYAKKLLSKASYDSAVASYNSAKARVSSAEAALNRAQQQVSYTEIKAAYSGVVSGRYVEEGEAVQSGMPLMSGFDPDRLRVFVDLPQSIASIVRNKPAIRVVLNDGASVLPIKTTFFPIADTATGTVRMRLELPQAQQGVYPGQLVKVAIQVGDRERMLVPASSIVYRSEVAGVYILHSEKEGAVQKGSAQKSSENSDVPLQPQLRQVRLGNRFADKVEILAGLMVDETIATDPIMAGIVAASLQLKEGE